MSERQFKRSPKPFKRRPRNEPVPMWLGMLTISAGVVIGYFGF
jgi:hypothetical protein